MTPTQTMPRRLITEGWIAICCVAALSAAGCQSLNRGEIARTSIRHEIQLVAADGESTLVTPSAIPCQECETPRDSMSCTAIETSEVRSTCCDCSPECLGCGRSPVCFGCDKENFLPTLWSDAKGVVNWNNSLILLAAGGTAIALRESEGDRDVREEFAKDPHRWGSASQVLGKLGNVEVQAPVLLGLYGVSLWTEDEQMHDVAGSLISATVITGAGTTALKLFTNTERPSDTWNNGDYGFPSYHAASTFAIAAVLDEYYGAKAGLPAYALAAAIGFSRLDEQDHDLSDVVFGGALGFVVGKAVAGRHLCGNSKIRFAPYFHPTTGSPGVCCETRF